MRALRTFFTRAAMHKIYIVPSVHLSNARACCAYHTYIVDACTPLTILHARSATHTDTVV